MAKRKVANKLNSAEIDDPADRRSSPLSARLAAGIFSLYHRSTGAKESDCFLRDEKSWRAFEEAALPEMMSFAFFDRKKNTPRTPNSVLADAMGDIWITETLPSVVGQPTTIQVINELVKRIAGTYEISPIERRTRKRASIGLDIEG